MGLRSNIDHLAAADGVAAAVVRTRGRETHFRGDEGWYVTLERALRLQEVSGQSELRIVLGRNTLVLQREGDETVAVAMPTGHHIAKSLRRMLRRMARRDRRPLHGAPAADETAERHEAPAPTTAESSPARPHASLTWAGLHS